MQLLIMSHDQTYQPFDYRLQSKIIFQAQQISRIQKRFQQFARNDLMDIESFKKLMGLLGIGQCEFLCDRIFPLITDRNQFEFDDFLFFLNTITYGSKQRKANISFHFLSKSRVGYISHADIEVVISEFSFIWNFLTGEKISNSDSIALVSNILGISEERSISFQQYLEVYDNSIDWYEYFNNQIKPPGSKKHHLNIDQIEEYLKLLYSQVQGMIGSLRQSQQTQEETQMMTSFSQLSQIPSLKGPTHVSFQEFKPRGDFDNPRQTFTCHRASALSRDIIAEGSSKVEIITKKLQQFSKLGQKLFPHYHHQSSPQSLTSRTKKKAVLNISSTNSGPKKIIYFGHENWNIMLNIMLGIRKSIKSHFYKFETNIDFTEEDLNCKYSHELIYKQNNKSVKQISEIFVDYTPKVFFYIRSYFKIQNNQFLKSIGLENLIGNFLMGNLTSLTDQTSGGKNGSFSYYTEDKKLIIKSIQKQQCLKLRQLLPDYAEYVKQNPSTFLSHIYGLYKLKNKQTNRQIYFIIVNNFFETELEISERYDINGSTCNRSSKIEGSNSTLKDVDLINNQNRKFILNADTKEKIYKQLIKDSLFLSSHNIIEYSLLIGIAKLAEENESKGFKSQNQREVFFFGIADILCEYSAKKVIENHFMNIFTTDNSCIAPEEYHERLKNFIYKYIFSS